MKFLILAIGFFIGIFVGFHFGNEIGFIDGFSQGNRQANMWWIDKKSTYFDVNELENNLLI